MEVFVSVASLVLSAVALAAALWSARESAELRKIERGRDERQDLLDRQAQARAVAAWMCVHDGDARKRWFLTIANDSSVPVYDAHAEISSRFENPPLDVALVPPGQSYFELEKGTWDFGRQLEELGIVPRPLTQANVFKVRRLTFTDSGGHRWNRDDHGRITESS